MNYEVGSMWRKWDLHVHSPFSILNQGDLGNAFNETKKDSVMDNYVHELFRRAIDEQIYAIGITDYFMIEGYKEVKKILGDGKRLSSIFSDEISRDIHYLDKIKNIMILPNIEFRLNLAIKEKTINGSNDSKMQIHVIFSDLLNIQKIEQNFLHLLTFAREMCDGRQTRYTLTKENLIAYGDDLKKTGVGGNENSLFVGTNNAYVILEDLLDILNTPDFLDNFIIILAEEDQSSLNWNNQLGGIRKNLYKASDAIFSSNEKTIKWGQSSDSFKILEKNLPCLWGSDAHEFNKMFKPDLNRYTWIKADTTFNGLTIALNNAPNRLFIGEFCKECESAKIRKNITIKEIKAQLKDTSNKSKVWFDIDLKLNPFLISIIGNKGSGKSALSDIIGHTANTTNSQYFSFLSENRFLSRKTKYGELYSSNLSFYDDSCVEKDNLSSPYNPTKNCLVKYLPQKYMEEICNDLNDTFQKEIDEMIFSYVPTQEKADSSSLLDLIATKTKSNLTTLFSNKSNLEKNNLEIRKLEEKSTNQYRQEIENRLNAQKRKFFEHDLNKPIEVKQPSEEFKHENSSKITTLSQMVYKIDDEITNKVKELTETNRKLNIIEEFMNSATE
ncbi:MAG: hypothetical protein PHS54_06020, partial [Clostridia bacterium]|nr:hypothetical protein [Clostridia bacterium]